MPYRWQDETAHSGPAREDAPHGKAARDRRRLVIWPHRSLPAAGFAWVIGLAAAGLALLIAPVTAIIAGLFLDDVAEVVALIQAADAERARTAAEPPRGYARLYRREVLQADEGCDLDFLRAEPQQP